MKKQKRPQNKLNLEAALMKAILSHHETYAEAADVCDLSEYVKNREERNVSAQGKTVHHLRDALFHAGQIIAEDAETQTYVACITIGSVAPVTGYLAARLENNTLHLMASAKEKHAHQRVASQTIDSFQAEWNQSTPAESLSLFQFL